MYKVPGVCSRPMTRVYRPPPASSLSNDDVMTSPRDKLGRVMQHAQDRFQGAWCDYGHSIFSRSIPSQILWNMMTVLAQQFDSH